MSKSLDDPLHAAAGRTPLPSRHASPVEGVDGYGGLSNRNVAMAVVFVIIISILVFMFVRRVRARSQLTQPAEATDNLPPIADGTRPEPGRPDRQTEQLAWEDRQRTMQHQHMQALHQQQMRQPQPVQPRPDPMFQPLT
jgi:hypothetical protein